MRRIVPYLSVVFAMLCWAGAGIAVKEALVVFSPLTLIVLRFSLAILLMLLVGLLFRGHEVLGLQCVDKRDIPLFVLGGLFQPFLYFIFETYTYQSFASPTIAEAMLSTQPIMAPILAFIILREKVTRNNVVGILISTVGMLLLLLVGANNFALGNPWGVLLAVVTVSMSVGYTIILRRIPTRYSSLSIVFQHRVEFLYEPGSKLLVSFHGRTVVAEEIHAEVFEMLLSCGNVVHNPLPAVADSAA